MEGGRRDRSRVRAGGERTSDQSEPRPPCLLNSDSHSHNQTALSAHSQHASEQPQAFQAVLRRDLASSERAEDAQVPRHGRPMTSCVRAPSLTSAHPRPAQGSKSTSHKPSQSIGYNTRPRLRESSRCLHSTSTFRRLAQPQHRPARHGTYIILLVEETHLGSSPCRQSV